jgi:arabinofuranosyltransferase
MKKYLPYAFLIIAVILASSNLIQKINYSPDDTYIYMQYARNLASGNGFAFNAGEPSYGITSPVWSVILSAVYLMGQDGYWFAKYLDLFFLIMSVFMFYKLAHAVFSKNYEEPEIIKTLTLLATSVFLLNSWLIRWSFTGMETSLAVFIVISVFFLLFKEQFTFAFVLLGVLFLVRPESFVLFFLAVLFLLFRKTPLKKIIPGLLIYAAIVSSFLLYAKTTFGTIFPNTTLGKATFSFGLSIYIEQLKRIFQTLALSNIIELILSAVFIFLLLKKRKWDASLLMLLWPAGLVFLYVITDADIISRYLLIIIPFIIITGISVIGNVKSKYAVISLIVFILVSFQSQMVFYKYVKPHTDNFSYGVKNCFMEIGKWLSENTPKDSKILVNDVGAIGYYSNRYIIDAAALVNRDLELNKRIMNTPVKERENTENLLRFVKADYLVQRDEQRGSSYVPNAIYKLDFILEREFPSLGITDPTPRYYKIYKVTNTN